MNKPIFYATEKDIFDILASLKKRITKSILFDLCINRGILLSYEEERDDIINYISMLPHDYIDLSALLAIARTNTRSERKTSMEVNTEIQSKDINTVIDAIKKDREKYGETYRVISESNNRSTIKVEYTVVDYGMTRLRQRVEKEGYIEVMKENGRTKIRRPANDKMQEITSGILTELKKVTRKELEEEAISLVHIRDPEIRILFFVSLIKNLSGFELVDVTHVRVSRLKDTDTREIDTDASDASEEIEQTEEVLIGHVSRAALDGIGLLNSEEYQNLKEKGFFISSLVWKSQEKAGRSGNQVVFEASFDNSEDFTNFVYNVKGYYKHTEEGFTITKLPFNELEKSSYHKLIEDAAKKALLECNKKYNEISRKAKK
ncbi:MAG: hypothetical protein LBE13_13775 [Bacteroidales bacterium]|jgi:hypothetical protein|nr:hypothetical protein [Bacteroidales bacterium]